MASFSNESENVSGLAGKVRLLVESDSFDLANYTETRAKDFITDSFSKPLTGPTSMIRVTLIVGGGKLVRSKYSDDLPKWISGSLRDIGYVEDNSAAETYDSQGTYKRQHDTGANLKYIIIYPHVTCASSNGSSSSGSNSTSSGSNSSSSVNKKSNDYIVISSDLSTFKEIVASKTKSWRQRKTLLKVLQTASDNFKLIEEKLMSGSLLSPVEQTIYEDNSGNDEEKIKCLQQEIKVMVDNGSLTVSEKEELLLTFDKNIAATDIDNDKKANMIKRKEIINKIVPIKYRLKYADEIIKLRIKLYPLLELEDKGRSMSLTIEDLQKIEQKNDIQNEINQYENASKSWFENEEDFQVEVASLLVECTAKYAEHKKKLSANKKSSSSSLGKGKAGSSSSSSSSSWSTVTSTSKIGVKGAVPKQQNTSRFAAINNDSDSD